MLVNQIRRRHILQFVSIVALSLVCSINQASGALATYVDFAAFQAAAFGSIDVTNFDSLTGPLTMDGDIMFSSDSGSGLHIYATDGINDDTVNPNNTIGPQNYVGNGNLGFPDLADELITIDFGSARSAVGIFFVHDTGAIPTLQITANGISRSESLVHQTFAPGIGTSAYFIGIVDDTGANSISTMTFEDSLGDVGYYFDHLVSFQTTAAVPEPTSFATLLLASGCVMMRRRRA